MSTTLMVIIIIIGASILILASYLISERKILTKIKPLRIRLYKAMLEELTQEINSPYSYGFCRLITIRRPWYMSDWISDYPELMKHKPVENYAFSIFISYWWDPMPGEFRVKRIEILTELTK